MAISRHLADRLCELLGSWGRGKRVLTLGVLDVYLTEAEFAALMARHGLQPSPIPGTERHSKVKKFRDRGWISADFFFKSLGLAEIVALDYSPFEGAEVLFDLNQPNPPEALAAAFDLIIDAGTLEHVFHVPNALSNISRMLRIGGRVAHHVPCSGHIDHGLYQFSPTLFSDYYSKNRFFCLAALVHRVPLAGNSNPDSFIPYSRALFAETCNTGLPGEYNYFDFFVFKKTARSTIGRIPQQSCYEEYAWKSQNWEQHVAAHSIAQASSPSAIMGKQQHAEVDPLTWSIREDLRARSKQILGVLNKDPNGAIHLYGAGRHTQILLALWGEYIPRPVSTILVTTRSVEEVSGIPVEGFDSFAARDTDLVVLSSLVYERQMAIEIERRDLGVWYLGLHDASLTNLP